MVELILPVVMLQAVLTFYNSGENSDSPVFQEKTEISQILNLVHQEAQRHSSIATASPCVPSETLVNFIKSLCLPFLRRCGLFIKFCALNSSFSHKFSQISSDGDEFTSLAALFQLQSSVDDILQQLANTKEIIDELFRQLQSFNNLSPPFQFQFSQLENSYEALLSKYNAMECPQCKKVPKIPTICLCCEQAAIVNAACCSDDEGTECIRVSTVVLPNNVQHMKTCAGKCFFFLAKDCLLFVARKAETKFGKTNNAVGYFHGSVYVDKYGEEDPGKYFLSPLTLGFTRGKPLFLDYGKCEQLRKLWLSPGAIDNESVKQGSKVYKL